MNDIFGWDYPPGCSSVPGDETGYCEVCGKNADFCVCPECQICGDAGNKLCYSKHGMVISEEQIEAFNESWGAIEAENKYYRLHGDELSAKEEKDWGQLPPPKGGGL